MIVKLNARSVQSLQPVPGRRLEYHDTEATGLVLRVTPSGHKSWAVLYRHRGRLRRLTLGTLDAISLSEARTRARDTVREASAGADPAGEKRAARTAETIADLCDAYIDRYAKRRKRSWREDDRMLRADVLPRWKDRAIADITRRDVRALIADVGARAPIAGNRLAALLSKMFRWAEDEELVESSPAARIGRPAKERQRARVLTDAELRTFWTATEALDVAMSAYWQIRLLTAQRGAEVASMRWSDLDLAGGWWTIPGEQAKNGLAHRVPITPTVRAILETLQARRDAILQAREARGDTTSQPIVYVLDGARGKRQQTEAAATFAIEDFTGHDLRRTAATRMAAGGIPRLTVSKILNHVETSVTAVYDRASYDDAKRAALVWWDATLAAILAGETAKVLPFAR